MPTTPAPCPASPKNGAAPAVRTRPPAVVAHNPAWFGAPLTAVIGASGRSENASAGAPPTGAIVPSAATSHRPASLGVATPPTTPPWPARTVRAPGRGGAVPKWYTDPSQPISQ